MKKYVNGFLLMLFFFSSLMVSAQGAKQEKSQEQRDAKRAEIKALKVAYLTEKLALTDAEAKKFWTLYNTHEEKKNAMRKQMHAYRKENKRKENLTDAEVEKIVDQQMDFQVQMVNEDKKFHDELKQVLPIQKVFTFYKAEKGFKRELMKKYRKGHGEGQQKEKLVSPLED